MKPMRRRIPRSIASSAEYLVCPICESGQLGSPEGSKPLIGCDSCGCAFDGIVLGILKEIVALPDASGKHACEECGHPEMRRLPDETFHCPDCGSEVLPVVPSTKSK
jgi:transcription elongation factor Elf1